MRDKPKGERRLPRPRSPFLSRTRSMTTESEGEAVYTGVTRTGCPQLYCSLTVATPILHVAALAGVARLIYGHHYRLDINR